MVLEEREMTVDFKWQNALKKVDTHKMCERNNELHLPDTVGTKT